MSDTKHFDSEGVVHEKGVSVTLSLLPKSL